MISLLARALCPRPTAALVDEPVPQSAAEALALTDTQKEEVLTNAERELMELQQLLGVMHKKGFKDGKEYQELVALYSQLSRSIMEAIKSNNLAATLVAAGPRGRATGQMVAPKRSLAGLKENLPRFTSVLGPPSARGKINLGPEVENLQKVLNWEKISVNIDGMYTPDTMTAVKTLQKKYGLPVNGIVGAETRKLLNTLIGKD